MSQLQPTGRLDASQHLSLTIGVAPRDEPGLDAFIRDIYDPASANYRHYLTPEQFTEKFGPTEQDYQTVVNYAKASGLNVTAQYSNRVVLDVEGAVADIEKALQVTLRMYPHPNEAREFFAPGTDPSVPFGVPIMHVGGLNNYMPPHPRHERRARAATSKVGSAPGGQLWGNDFRDAYVPGTALTGAGQSVGLLEFEGYYAKDITAYENAIGMSAQNRPQLVVVPLNGGATPRDGGDNGEECSIDIEMALSMAPGLSKIYVFENGGNGNSNGAFDDILESMVAHPSILQFSCSWGGSTVKDPTSEALFKQMAAQGQSFFDASGDSGAFSGAVEFPSDSPSITQVGGTTLADGGAPNYPWESEVVWDWYNGPTVSGYEATSSSGGISTYYAIPSWQANIDMTANMGSTTMRNIPDVAANADNCYIFCDNGQELGQFGGTSCAAPLWAALTALMNQQAAAANAPAVGFLNPALYALAAGPGYSDCFHDITSGDNTWVDSPSQFYAVPGYDLCCGLGSVNGVNLINALVSATPFGSLQVTISPAAAIASGAKWQADGGAFQRSGTTLSNLSAGDHTISFNTINGWATPASQSVAVSADSTTTASATYVAIGSLKVTIGPSLVLNAGAQWQVDGGSWQNSAATVSNLAVGNHAVSFSAVSGWTAPSNVTVSIKARLVTPATESYVFGSAGVYNGLFAQAPPTVATSGMVKALTVTKSGTYSGRLLTGAAAYMITGSFDSSGNARKFVNRTVAQGGPLTLDMTLNWNHSPPDITGSVSATNGGGWTAGLTNELAVTGSTSAAYTALISPGAPPGYGYLLITNRAGAVTLTGALADGTPVVQLVPLSGNGDLPVYASLYGGNGLLLGWIGLENGSPTGSLVWIKQPSRSALYPSGFTNTATVQGSPWVRPSPQQAAIDLTEGLLTVAGAQLPSDLTFNVAVSSNNTLVKLPESPTNSLTGFINPNTGLLTIAFGNGVGRATTIGKGAVLQNTSAAGGYFLGRTNAGSIYLQ